MNHRTACYFQIPSFFSFTLDLNAVRRDVQPASSLLLVSNGEESSSSHWARRMNSVIRGRTEQVTSLGKGGNLRLKDSTLKYCMKKGGVISRSLLGYGTMSIGKCRRFVRSCCLENLCGTVLTLNIPREVLWGPPLVCYWLTSVEINKQKYLILTMLESLNYSFRNPKNIIWVIYRIKQLRNYKKNHVVLRGPQLGKQRWRARLGILKVKRASNSACPTTLLPSLQTSQIIVSHYVHLIL